LRWHCIDDLLGFAHFGWEGLVAAVAAVLLLLLLFVDEDYREE